MVNKAIYFTVCRYVIYTAQFLRGIFLAKFLDPSFFGIFSFLLLVQTYLSYCSLGIPYAINLEIASVNTEKKKKQYISSSFTIIILLVCLINFLSWVVWIFDIHIFEKYHLLSYILIVGFISSLAILREYFSQISRVHGELLKIAICELIPAALLLIGCFLYKGSRLIDSQLFFTGAAGIITTIIFMWPANVKYQFGFDFKKVKHLFILGISLFLSNVSFYLISVASRTIISIYYSAEILGFYSLANSIASATILGLSSITWTVYPAIISKIANCNSGEEILLIKQVNDIYNTSVALIVFVALCLLPIIFTYIPRYEAAEESIILLLISQIFVTSGFGFSSMLNAKRQQWKLFIINLISLAIVISSSLIIANYGLNFNLIALATIGGYSVFLILLVSYCAFLSRLKFFTAFFVNTFHFSTVISVLFILLSILYGCSRIGNFIALLLFLLFNSKKIKNVWTVIKMKNMQLPSGI